MNIIVIGSGTRFICEGEETVYEKTGDGHIIFGDCMYKFNAVKEGTTELVYVEEATRIIILSN